MLFIHFKYHRTCLICGIHVDFDMFEKKSQLMNSINSGVTAFRTKACARKIVNRKNKIDDFKRIINMIPELSKETREKVVCSYSKFMNTV